MNANPYLPMEAEVVERVQETPSLFTLRLRFCDPDINAAYHSVPGQFNMLYLYGVGEVPISIVSDPGRDTLLDHTIRAVGRVTDGLAKLQPGDRLGIRGPYGRGWPLEMAKDKDVVILTGGLGCAPVVSAIKHVIHHRGDYGRLVIMQGVKHSDDLIWREQYEAWSKQANTQVLLAADIAGNNWPWMVGRVTGLLEQAEFDKTNCTVMMCGPEIMMKFSIQELLQREIPEQNIWVTMERNMQCAIGHCGHCQFGGAFVCKDGPVFSYPEIKPLFGVLGF